MFYFLGVDCLRRSSTFDLTAGIPVFACLDFLFFLDIRRTLNGRLLAFLEPELFGSIFGVPGDASLLAANYIFYQDIVNIYFCTLFFVICDR